MALSRLLDARRGPRQIILVRHGESCGNLADAEAQRVGAERLDLDDRDADVELSETGQRQAEALRRWLADDADPALRPDVVVSSPYRRAAETARRAMTDLDVELTYDERLRERDMGVFDGLTGAGIRAAYPEEADRRRKLGKFYYQPPQGESWCDVVARIRALLADLREACDGQTVWLFSHQAVIMSFRYVLEGMDEKQVLEADASIRIGNASVSHYRRGEDGFELIRFADTTAVDTYADATYESPRSQEGRHPGPTDEGLG